jgi:hypothetical protein
MGGGDPGKTYPGYRLLHPGVKKAPDPGSGALNAGMTPERQPIGFQAQSLRTEEYALLAEVTEKRVKIC